MISAIDTYCSETKVHFIPSDKALDWDVYISAFNDSERVQSVFSDVSATRKVWCMLPEYEYVLEDFPNEGEVIDLHETEEELIIRELLDKIDISSLLGKKICIDITGFMRPQLLFMMRYLPLLGIKKFDMVYTEPSQYTLKSETQFSRSSVREVKLVAGYAGIHDTDLSNDHLIVGVGYDHELIGRVVLEKEHAQLIQLHSFPSLSADMYHESILRLYKVEGTLPRLPDEEVFFCSANDPYVTAATLSEAVKKLNEREKITNLYLSPLATKVQVIGFGLFFLTEMQNKATSMIFPFISKYNRNTSTGIGRSWVYPISLEVAASG